MKLLLRIYLCVLSFSMLKADEAASIPSIEELRVKGLPRVGELATMPKLSELEILISSPSERARKLTWSGFCFLHSGWDFEAFRYFSEALVEDDQCLMAHSGYVLALTAPFHHEHLDQRKAAVLRILALAEVKRGEDFFYPEKERGFAIAVCLLITEGREGAARAFAKLAEEYPEDAQIPLIALAFLRDGYDILRKPRVGEKKALLTIKKLYQASPSNPLTAQYLINMYLDAPLDHEVLEREVLPIARQLNSSDEVIVWKYWLGVIEYRCGNLKEAKVAFEKCLRSLKLWTALNKISVADADLLWKTYCYLAQVRYELGDTEGALEIVKMFSKLEIDDSRFIASGSQVVLWEGYSLGVRLGLEDGYGDADLASTLYPNKKLLEPLVGKSATAFYYDYLGVYIGMRKAVKAKDQKAVDALYDLLHAKAKVLEEMEVAASKTPESRWSSRYFKHAKILQILSLNAGEASLALERISLQQAVDYIDNGARRLPPLFFKPIDIRLASMLMKSDQLEKASDVLNASVSFRPSVYASWEALRDVAVRSGDTKLEDKASVFLKKLR